MSDEQIRRRTFLQALGILGAAAAVEGVSGATKRLPALTISRPGPDDPPVPNEFVQEIYDQRFGKRTIQRGHISLDMPAMAEDGRYVPVVIESDLPATPDQYIRHLYLIVDHNPDPLVTAFHFTPALGPLNLQTRIKMKRTTWIRAIAETNTGELWADYLKVETTLNGCG
ncbi:MAG TPA: thiosulfate oxidation carrier protein SoxY [Gemmatimonadales bacterium]|nr:thiosulfate oxidation carrier protein SoxY [Gemmatimonadales bacterium]